MWKLIKMDSYRLFSSKTVKLGVLLSTLVCAAYILISFGIVYITEYAVRENLEVGEGMSVFFPQCAWLSGVDFSEIVFSATSAFSLFVGCMITANFIGAEQSCGYTKNFAGQLSNKGYMAISKFAVTSIAQAMVLLIYVAVAAVMALLLLGNYIDGYDIPTLAAALGLRLMLHLAVNAIIIFICTLTKSHAIAMVVGCIFGIGVTRAVYFTAEGVLALANVKLEISSLMPDGINNNLTLDSLGEMVGSAIPVSIVFVVVFVAANYVLMRQRDVR